MKQVYDGIPLKTRDSSQMSLLLPASVKLDYGLVKFSPTERTKVMTNVPRCHDTFLKPPALTDSPTGLVTQARGFWVWEPVAAADIYALLSLDFLIYSNNFMLEIQTVTL